MDFAERFNSKEIVSLRSEIDNAWSRNSSEISKNFELETIMRVVTENDLYYPLVTVFDLYQQMALCVKYDACEANLAFDKFGPETRAFYNRWTYFVQLRGFELNDENYLSDLWRFTILSSPLSEKSEPWQETLEKWQKSS